MALETPNRRTKQIVGQVGFRKRCVVASRVRLALQRPVVERGELHPQERGLKRVDAKVPADESVVVKPAGYDAIGQEP